MGYFVRGYSTKTAVAVTATRGVLTAVLIFGIAIGLLAKRETRRLAVRTVLAPLLTVLAGIVLWNCGQGIAAVWFDAVGYIWLWVAVNHVTRGR